MSNLLRNHQGGNNVRRTKLVALAAATAAVVALASVGVAGADVRRQNTGITDDEITVAGLGPNNPYKQFGADTGAMARFKVANDDGGVNGRTINYLGWTDDGNSADTNLQETRRLIQQEGVAALVPVLTPWFLEGAEFAEQQGIPSFGWGIAAGFCETKFAFGFSGCLVPAAADQDREQHVGLADRRVLPGQGEEQGAEGKTAAVIAEDNDSGKSGAPVIAATAKAVGMDVVYEKATMPAAEGGTPVSDFTPYTSEIMTSADGGPPDVVFGVISQNNLLGFAPALDAAGFEGLQTQRRAVRAAGRRDHHGRLRPDAVRDARGRRTPRRPCRSSWTPSRPSNRRLRSTSRRSRATSRPTCSSRRSRRPGRTRRPSRSRRLRPR